MSGDVYDMFNNREDPRCPCAEKEGLDCKEAGYYCSVMNVINKVVYFISKAGPGNWNDLDMLRESKATAEKRILLIKRQRLVRVA